jgi:hypothetical protein
LSNLNGLYPETFSNLVTIPVGLGVILYAFNKTAKEVRKPLNESISASENLPMEI